MASTTSIEELMRNSGVTDKELAAINLGTPEEASNRSLRAFVRNQLGEEPADLKESRGMLHFTGPAIIGHSAPINAVGNVMMKLQAAIDAIGASKEGFSSISGQIPNRVKARTELRMEASPVAGSVVINVRPSMPRNEDLHSEEPTLFDPEGEVGIKPLADECFEDFLRILSSTTDDSPAYENLIDILSELGPRTSSAVRDFCSCLDDDMLDVDLRWEEPKSNPINGEMNHARAKFVSDVIKDADIEVEIITLEGMLMTSTVSKKDKLRIRTENGDEKTLSLGKIDTADVVYFRPGDEVKISAERRIGKYTGGRQKEWLIGITIAPKGQLSLDELAKE